MVLVAVNMDLMIITANGASSDVRICRYISLECTQSGDIEGQGCDEASRGFYGCEGGGDDNRDDMVVKFTLM
jgi:hypothetical protein